MKVYVPSYRRSQYIKTPKYLVDRCYFDPESIFVGVQTEEDLNLYRRSDMIPEGTNIILADGAHSAGTNRNHGIRMFQGEKVLFMDDDVSAITARSSSEEDDDCKDSDFIVRGARIRRLNAIGLSRLIRTWSSLLDVDGVRLVTPSYSSRSVVYSTFSGRRRFRNGMPFVSTMFMMNCGDLRFDDRLKVCEDFDLAVRAHLNGERCVRDRAYSLSTRFRIDRNGEDAITVPGGTLDQRKTHLMSDREEIVRRYPNLLSIDSNRRVHWRIRGEDLIAPDECYEIPDDSEFYSSMRKGRS